MSFQPSDRKTHSVDRRSENPCEYGVGKGLVDGRVEGRIGVHVESEGVLKCEGYNKEGTCDMLCWM